MPQLNPSPWFLIMVFSWLIFLTVIPQKITAHTSPNDLNPLNTQTPKTEPWNWPWH